MHSLVELSFIQKAGNKLNKFEIFEWYQVSFGEMLEIVSFSCTLFPSISNSLINKNGSTGHTIKYTNGYFISQIDFLQILLRKGVRITETFDLSLDSFWN